MKTEIKFILCLIFLVQTSLLFAQDKKNTRIAAWSFDEVNNNKTKDAISGFDDEITGYYSLVKGVAGKAIKCDGFTTAIMREGEDAPVVKSAFTVEAWVAPQAYPWNWCAVYSQEYTHNRGFFFGIDGEGRVGLHAAIARQWRECISEKKIPFMEWSHIAATFDPEQGMKVYINGELSGELKVIGDLLYDRQIDMAIGRNHELTAPSSLNRGGFVREVASYSFDGLIDEINIHAGAFSDEKIKKSADKFNPGKPALKSRKLPEIPNSNEFGAFYTRLKYDEDWDRLWKDDEFPDIVITFPNKEHTMVFWKGTNYNMNLVSENGKWVADQSAETFGDLGCMEHMSDKQNRYSHIRLIENTAARIVVHWRYALTDVSYKIANTNPRTNWGDWADEYYYVYPDGYAVRLFKIHAEDRSEEEEEEER
ncbi:MAG: LamG domain-containing protein [Bacteroidota bacterium]